MSKKDARFWNLIAMFYFKQPIKDEEAYRIKLKTTQEYLLPDMDILEIGCGSGSTALAHAPYVRHVTATDIAGRMIEIANGQKAEKGLSNIDFKKATLEDLMPLEKRYDAILALSLLHLLEEPSEGLKHIKALLKPGGVFIANTPCLEGKLGIMKPILKFGHFIGLMPRISTFSESQLTKWL